MTDPPFWELYLEWQPSGDAIPLTWSVWFTNAKDAQLVYDLIAKEWQLTRATIEPVFPAEAFHEIDATRAIQIAQETMAKMRSLVYP